MKGKGWYGNKYGHKLASKGIKTKQEWEEHWKKYGRTTSDPDPDLTWCPNCGKELIEIFEDGNYKYDCPNCSWVYEKDYLKHGFCNHEWEEEYGDVYCIKCGEEYPKEPEWDTESLQDSRPDLFDERGRRRSDY